MAIDRYKSFLERKMISQQISFYKDNKKYEFNGKSKKEVFELVVSWLYNSGYTFGKYIKLYNDISKKDLINKSSLRNDMFSKLDNDLYAINTFIKDYSHLINSLEEFGCEDIKIDSKEIDDKNIDMVVDGKDDDVVNLKSVNYLKNPFGCKQEDGTETSTLCILGKSGSGKTTTTENALESMEHEVLLYIPIEGEYTFSQYTGSSFEMSSLGEFVMTAQNNPNRYYTVIIDECHRPITLSKLNTDLLQALSSRRNRNGQRFFTMDRSTKRMYVTPSEEFPIPLKEQIGKILVPDNFGIVCLSSNPSVISRNDDFLNRVDIAIFRKSDRDKEDLTELEKLDSKDTNTIRGALDSDGIN